MMGFVSAFKPMHFAGQTPASSTPQNKGAVCVDLPAIQAIYAAQHQKDAAEVDQFVSLLKGKPVVQQGFQQWLKDYVKKITGATVTNIIPAVKVTRPEQVNALVLNTQASSAEALPKVDADIVDFFNTKAPSVNGQLNAEAL